MSPMSDAPQMSRRERWWRGLAGLTMVGCFCLYAVCDLHKHDMDRWWRDDLESRFPAGSDPHRCCS